MTRAFSLARLRLVDTSFVVEFEDELRHQQPAAAHACLAAHRSEPTAISIITVGEFAEGFKDPAVFGAFIGRYRVVQLSRTIGWWAAMLQTSLPQRLGENDAWIAATSLVPRLHYLKF